MFLKFINSQPDFTKGGDKLIGEFLGAAYFFLHNSQIGRATQIFIFRKYLVRRYLSLRIRSIEEFAKPFKIPQIALESL